MNIIIAGMGKVGIALAGELSKLKHNITAVDISEAVLEECSNRLDISAIHGSGMSPEVLKGAGADDADLLISVTGNDELNIVMCIVASRLGTANTVARVRNPEYSAELELLKKGLGISRIINPELDAAVEISRLLALPSADRVDTFANERVELTEYTLESSDLLIGKSLDGFALPPNVLVCGVEKRYGDDVEFIIPRGSYTFEAGDTLFLSGTLVSMNSFFKVIGHTSHKAKNIMIIGGSRISVYLARLARKMGINVRLIENNSARSVELTKLLDDCLIICGDGTDEEVLLSEDLGKMDAFITLTDNDEENMVSAYFARRQGVPKVIPKINRQNYFGMLRDLGFESMLCPKMITAAHMARYVGALGNTKSQAMQKLYRIAGGQAEAVEFIAPDDSKALNIPIQELKLKRDLLIAAIVHGKEIIIPTGKSVLRAHDQILIFSKNLRLDELDDILN